MQYNLVFEGGGAKGFVFVGALQEFKRLGHTARRFIGTSAGAITATLMAAGYEPADLHDAVRQRTPDGKPRFATFMDIPEKAHFKDLKASLTYAILERVDLPWIPKMAENLIDWAILEALMGLKYYRQSFSFIECGGLYAGEAFRAWLTEMLNAKDLQHPKDPKDPKDPPLGEATLLSFHERTKSDLSLVASDTKGQEMLVLNHRTAPDCPVAWAVRMSMSIPFLWQEVHWDRAWGLYRGRRIENHTIVDGGVLSNFPIELLTSRDPDVIAMMGDPDAAPNLGLLIDETLPEETPEAEGAGEAGDQEDAAAKKGGSSLEERSRKAVGRISRLVNTITNSRDTPAIEAHAEEICRLPARGYGTAEFDMNEERQKALIQAGKIAMGEYLDRQPYDATQASRHAECSPATLRNAMKSGALEYEGGGNRPYRIKQTVLAEWMAARSEAGKALP